MCPLVTGSFRCRGWAGELLFGLKPGKGGRKARNRLKSVSPVCLKFYGSAVVGPKPPGDGREGHSEVVRAVFRWKWLIHGESRANVSWITMFAGKPAHYPARKCRGSCKEMQGKVEISIGISFYTEIYAKSAVDQCFGRDVRKPRPILQTFDAPGRTDSALRPSEICPSWKWFRIVPYSDKHGSTGNII